MRVAPSTVFVALLLVAFAALPVYTVSFEQPFYLALVRRIMILAIAALGLNLIMGYGGLISMGHAAFIGIGGYTVGILAHHDVTSAGIQWPLALAFAAAVALVFGLISLRTRGVYFIMITLALAQMMFFLGVSLEAYGGDDGLPVLSRSDFGGAIDLGDDVTFYYFVYALLLACFWLMSRLVNSRFGMVIRGIRSNEARMQAIGFATLRYQLTAFVLAGMMAGLAGALLANHTDFINPEMAHWTRSAELLVMVLLGGMGSIAGPIVGAAALLLLEELLAGITEYWALILGPIMIVIVLFARNGLLGMIDRWSGRDG
jgi:branched-chain amino acid transport system permease protein